MRCSKCGAENRETARFCDACGTALLADAPAIVARSAPAASVTGERRHLTVLFCDLVNSTRIAAQLDPEEWREVIASYHRATAEAITRFGGHVAQYLGDGVMAYFGWPEAHDNAAESAARAGLAIVDQIAQLSPQPAHAKLSARVGIDSGRVVVGAGSGQDADVFGDVPNIAARTQAAAEPDMVVVTGATQQLISGLFVVEDRGAQSVRGIESPVQLYRLIRPSGARGRLEAIAAARGLTQFVGREQELRLLMNSWERTLTGEGQAVLIIGEPGIGKSRLLQQFHQRIAGIPYAWAEAAASRFFQNTPFYAVADAVRRLQEIYGTQLGRVPPRRAPSNAARRRQGKLSEIAAQGRSRRPTSPVNAGGSNGQSANGALAEVREQLGRFRSALEWESDPSIAQLFLAARAEDPAPQFASGEQRRRLMSALIEWILRATQVMPVVIAIEDLHWADPSTLELLDLLIQQWPKAPLMLLQTARTEFRPDWRPSEHLLQITLNPLNTNSARTMVQRVAGQTTLPEETITAVVERTGGVPLFVEELTRALLESGTAKPTAREIPATLQDSLMARLDKLGPAKEILQIGAVIGSDFSYELLRAVHPVAEQDLQEALQRAANAELIYVNGIAPDATYQFRHALIRDAAYEALLRSKRRELHTRIAQTIEERFADLAAAQPEILAYHYTEAGVVERAVSYWREAGRRAIERSANIEAIAHLRKGLELIKALPPDPQRPIEEVKLQIALTTPLIATAGYTAPEVEKASSRALELCQQLGDAPQLFGALGSLQSIYFNRGEFEIALEVAKQMLRLAESQQNAVSVLWAHYALGITLAHQGEWNSAREHLARSIALYDQRRAGRYGFVQDPGPTAIALLAHALHALGYPQQALGRMREAVAQARSLAHPFTLAWVLNSAAELRWQVGQTSAALELSKEQVELCFNQGFKNLLALASLRIGFAEVEEGKHEDGLSRMREGLSGLMDFIDRLHGVAILALAEGKAGQVDKGLARIDDALVLVRKSPTFHLTLRLNLIKGQLLLMKTPSGLRKARQYFTRGIELARDQNAKSEELAAAIQLTRVLVRQGHRDRARSMLKKIYNWFTEGFDTADLKEAKALLGELSLQPRR